MLEICTSGIFVELCDPYTYRFWMSDSFARSSIFSRATTGIFRSPSCSAVTVTPLIALVAEFATSMLVIPARLARSGSTFKLTVGLSVSHSLRTRSAAGADRKMSATCDAICRMVRMSCALPAVLTSARLVTRISTG